MPIEIDGITQPGSTCPTVNAPATLLIVLDGSNAGTGVDGLYLTGDSEGSGVRGLVIGNFALHGIRIGSDYNVVRCNHIGVGTDGTSPLGNNSSGIFISGDNNLVGGQLAVHRNVLAGNTMNGARVSGGQENVFINNYVGTTADGMSALSNSGGLYISGVNNVVGGIAPLAHNTLSGNVGYGLRINNGDGTVVLGNLIGVASDGSTSLPNSSSGIEILGEAITNTVGGTNANQANIIMNNGSDGVVVDDNVGGMPIRNTIRGNIIYNNDDLGIDLGSDGIDVNDPGDGDGGQNEHQNYPILGTVTDSELLTITLDSLANTQFIIDIYRNDTCDPTGHGEGQEYLTETAIMTDGTGAAEAVIDLSGQVADGDEIAATATDPDGNTSEFSACALIEMTPPPTPTPTITMTPSPSATPSATYTPTPTGTISPTPTATIPPKVTMTSTPPPGDTFFIYLPVMIN